MAHPTGLVKMQISGRSPRHLNECLVIVNPNWHFKMGFFLIFKLIYLMLMSVFACMFVCTPSVLESLELDFK